MMKKINTLMVKKNYYVLATGRYGLKSAWEKIIIIE